MGGRRIFLQEPIDMQAAVATTDIFTVRRAIRNGQFSCQAGLDGYGRLDVSGHYSVSSPLKLTM